MELQINIPYEEIKKYIDAVNKKKRGKHGCRVWPRASFDFGNSPHSGTNGKIRFSGLVCSSADPEIGGDATGVSAQWCKNCKIKAKKKGSR